MVADNGDVIETNAENIISKQFKRRWIKNHKWVTINAFWDSNWACDDLEQFFVAYEEDNNVVNPYIGFYYDYSYVCCGKYLCGKCNLINLNTCRR